MDPMPHYNPSSLALFSGSTRIAAMRALDTYFADGTRYFIFSVDKEDRDTLLAAKKDDLYLVEVDPSGAEEPRLISPVAWQGSLIPDRFTVQRVERPPSVAWKTTWKKTVSVGLPPPTGGKAPARSRTRRAGKKR